MVASPSVARRRLWLIQAENPSTTQGADAEMGVAGHRHGSRTRQLTGTFGRNTITVPRARLAPFVRSVS